jgi:hypothetical protein
MWFIADRDERDEEEVRKMEARLGPRAKLKVLERRELENYLLDDAAIRKLVEEKRKPTPNAPPLTAQSIADALREATTHLRPEGVRLRLERRLLTPIFLNVRTMRGSPEERLRTAADLIKGRLDTIEGEKAKIEEELGRQWAAHALDVVPGTLLLEQAVTKLGASYVKEAGDSERLARYMNPDAIPKEIKDLLAEVTRE